MVWKDIVVCRNYPNVKEVIVVKKDSFFKKNNPKDLVTKKLKRKFK